VNVAFVHIRRRGLALIYQNELVFEFKIVVDRRDGRERVDRDERKETLLLSQQKFEVLFGPRVPKIRRVQIQ